MERGGIEMFGPKQTILLIIRLLVSKGMLDKQDLEFFENLPNGLLIETAIKMIEEKYPIE